MRIHLPRDLEEIVQRKVDRGEYDSPSDVVIHALYLLDARDRVRATQLEELKREIAIGLEQCERGETKPFTAETVKQIRARGRARLAQRAERLKAEAEQMAEQARQMSNEIAEAD